MSDISDLIDIDILEMVDIDQYNLNICKTI